MASISFLTAAQDGLLHGVWADEHHWECGILFTLPPMMESVVRDVGLLNIVRGEPSTLRGLYVHSR